MYEAVAKLHITHMTYKGKLNLINGNYYKYCNISDNCTRGIGGTLLPGGTGNPSFLCEGATVHDLGLACPTL